MFRICRKSLVCKASSVASHQTRWHNKRILRKGYSVPRDFSWIENYKLIGYYHNVARVCGFYCFLAIHPLFVFADGRGERVTKNVIFCRSHKCNPIYLQLFHSPILKPIKFSRLLKMGLWALKNKLIHSIKKVKYLVSKCQVCQKRIQNSVEYRRWIFLWK